MVQAQLLTGKLQHPENLSPSDIPWLEEMTDQYPYFQSARALYLKGLHNQRSHLYNAELKKTAAYTQDRDVLFDFIVSEQFVSYKPVHIEQLEVIEEDYIISSKNEPTLEENIEKSILSSLAYIQNPEKENPLLYKLEQLPSQKNTIKEEIPQKQVPDTVISEIEEKLEIGEPLSFEASEKHSFAEWLKLTSAQPIERAVSPDTEKENSIPENTSDERQKKIALIDRFIEMNPKIIPSKQPLPPPAFVERDEDGQPYLMTETLAKIYLEQKKYQKAIQAYEILILKYPEKSSLFADRIHDIKMLQHYNS